MEWHKEIKAGLSPIVDLVYPPRCPSCGASVAAHGGLCLDCWTRLDRLDPQESTSDHAEGEVLAACAYGEVSRQLILNFKHGGKTALAPVLARLMAVQLPDSEATDTPLIVPVPLHRLRLWERGYNQAALLAQELAKLGKGELGVDTLKRAKRTPSLGGLGKEERREVLKDAIAVRKGKRRTLAGRDVLLIDDVYTSGATSSACATALNGAGARSVKTLCFARVMN